MVKPELEQGEEIRLSMKKALVASGTVTISLVIGAIAPLLGVGMFVAWRGGEVHGVVALPLGLLFFFVGFCFLTYGVLVGASVIVGVVRQDRLLLGEKSLQSVTRDGRILTCVPYDNIDEITLVEEPSDDEGPSYFMVAITLVDRTREDTLVQEKSPLVGEDGYEVLIRDLYRVPPKKLYKKLRARAKQAK